MQMHFEGSSNVTLLFDFWNVHEPGGMVLSVVVVLLFTVMYELLKVWRVTLEKRAEPLQTPPAPTTFSPTPPSNSPVLEHHGNHSQSEASLAHTENSSTPVLGTSKSKSWRLHSLQTVLHVIQVVLGYMLMLCIMSYNVWIFLGIIVGSALGYFFAFPFLVHIK